MDWKDILVRALKTGGQAAIAAFIATVGGLAPIADLDALKAAAVTVGMAVLSAFVSAVWNAIIRAWTKPSDGGE